MMDLQLIWYILIGVLIIGYAILDGFDLGVGVLHLFAKNAEERNQHINAIAPVWDGNEVWLLTGGGALFAAFPKAYATIFSSFYLAFVLLLLALIFRAVSMEFRSRIENHIWQRIWDWAFGLGSLVPALLLGVAFGNLLRGIPLDGNMQFTGTFLGLLNPFSLLCGLTSLVLLTMHGAIYLQMKTQGKLAERLQHWATTCWCIVMVLIVACVLYSYFEANHLFRDVFKRPLFWVSLIGLALSAVAIPVLLHKGKALPAFIASSVAIAMAILASGALLHPNLVISSTDLANSLTIRNASATQGSLQAMLVIAGIGMPIVIAYTAIVYRIFKGKVNSTDVHY